MNKQQLREYIRKNLKEATLYSTPKDAMNDPKVRQNPKLKTILQGKTQTEPVEIAEAEQNIRTSFQRLLLLSREIADSVEDADLDSPEIISLQSDVDNFVKTVLKPFYNKL